MNKNLILDENIVENRLELEMLNFIYLSWITKEKILRNTVPLLCDTPINNLLLFTIFIKNTSSSLYFLSLDYIHSRSRKYYLTQK